MQLISYIPSQAGDPRGFLVLFHPHRRSHAVQVGIRPEHLSTAGPARRTAEGERLVVEQRGPATGRAGEAVPVGLDPRDLRVFDAEGRRLR